MTYLFLFMGAFFAWLIGTVTAGGASIIFLLILSLFLPISIVPILISFVGTFAGFYRAAAFRQYAYWPILKWLLPGTIVGSCCGAAIFALLMNQSGLILLEFLLSLVLLFSGVLGLIKKKRTASNRKNSLFLPCGFFISTLSGMIGAAPPIVNALYQRFSLTPNQLMGTKSINLFVLQMVKSVVYIAIIFFYPRSHIHTFSTIKSWQDLIVLSLVAGLGAALGISVGKRILANINPGLFKRIMNGMLIIFGVYFFVLFCF